jgi:SET domain-containing protein
MVALPAADCWLHPDVEVRRSPISGRGLFARRLLTADTVVSRLGGRLVSAIELQEIVAAATLDPQQPYVDTIVVDEDVHLVLPPRRDNGYGNHSCDPNLWWIDAYTLAARRDIPAGEELTNDYATSAGVESFTMGCSCGSPLCRRVITGNDWRIPALQLRYGNHWVPGLSARIFAIGRPMCAADADAS